VSYVSDSGATVMRRGRGPEKRAFGQARSAPGEGAPPQRGVCVGSRAGRGLAGRRAAVRPLSRYGERCWGPPVPLPRWQASAACRGRAGNRPRGADARKPAGSRLASEHMGGGAASDAAAKRKR
jgi:hypothetical protein